MSHKRTKILVVLTMTFTLLVAGVARADRIDYSGYIQPYYYVYPPAFEIFSGTYTKATIQIQDDLNWNVAARYRFSAEYCSSYGCSSQTLSQGTFCRLVENVPIPTYANRLYIYPGTAVEGDYECGNLGFATHGLVTLRQF